MLYLPLLLHCKARANNKYLFRKDKYKVNKDTSDKRFSAFLPTLQKNYKFKTLHITLKAGKKKLSNNCVCQQRDNSPFCGTTVTSDGEGTQLKQEIERLLT